MQERKAGHVHKRLAAEISDEGKFSGRVTSECEACLARDSEIARLRAECDRLHAVEGVFMGMDCRVDGDGPCGICKKCAQAYFADAWRLRAELEKAAGALAAASALADAAATVNGNAGDAFDHDAPVRVKYLERLDKATRAYRAALAPTASRADEAAGGEGTA